MIGTCKGRGFAGVVRRHGFGGGPKSHGHMFQVQGSIGASSFPSRVFPGQRMPGHMGHDQVTVRNLRIRGIDLDENLLMVEGAVPGPRDGYVLISKAKAPPRERRGFAGAGTRRSAEGFEEGFARRRSKPARQAECAFGAVAGQADCRQQHSARRTDRFKQTNKVRARRIDGRTEREVRTMANIDVVNLGGAKVG